MVAYLVALDTGAGPDRLAPLREAAWGEGGWRVAVDQPGVLIMVRSEAPVRLLQAGRGWVIGDLYREGRPVGAEPPSVRISQALPGVEVAADLCTHFWGRYVAVIRETDGTILAFRDPSGAVEAMRWEVGPVALLGSELPAWLPAVYWPDLSIDWSAVGRWLISSSAAAVTSGLAGLSSVTPGAVQDGLGAERQIWRPEQFARAPLPDVEALPERLDRCVGALASSSGAIQAEISGGLDSAILAASLARTAGGKVREWINYHAADGQGDERVFARQVAALWELPLVEAVKPPLALTPELLEEGAGGVRPGFTALDGQRDLDGAARALALAADRVFTGQGGDMVFFQTPTPVLAVEVVHPLMCQPMMEQWLAIPADMLTLGGRDRGLARKAFGERLPPSIRERRGKGELTSYYGRGVAASLPWARSYLLDGRLAAEGLIDRARFEQVLTPEHQIWRGEAYLVLTALTVEAWVRRWETAGRA